MAYKQTVDMVDADGEISVTHCYWGLTAKEAEAAMEEHLADDKALAAAQAEGRTIEDLEEIEEDELPEVEEDVEETDEEEEIS